MKWIMNSLLMVSILLMASSALFGCNDCFGEIGVVLFVITLIVEWEEIYQEHLDAIADRVNSRKKS